MTKKISLKRQIEAKISRCWKRNVFSRKDFVSMGSYDQVGRALLSLSREGKLIRIGYGLYAKARLNRITGLPMLSAEGGFDQVAKEALDLLGIEWQSNICEQEYNNVSRQIPVNSMVFINGRFNRKIGTDKFKLKLQRN